MRRSPTRHIIRAIRAPGRTARVLFTRDGWSGIYWLVRSSTQAGRLDSSLRPLASRAYESYDAYVAHQRSKLALLDLSDYDRAFRSGLSQRLAAQDWSGRSVLCLAARIGTEVKAFHDVGAFAVGIDLNPGQQNPYVLPGDFHHLVFASSSVDAVYCNALDHALDLDRITQEVRRVLKPGGIFLVDAQQGASDVKFDNWAATSWQRIDDLVAVIEKAGLPMTDRRSITVPWTGEQLTFTSADES